MAIQTLGQDGTSILAVDATFDAARVTMRPMECTGWFTVGAVSGALTVAGANTAVFSFRNISANPVFVRRVGVGFVTTTAFTTAQQVNYGLMVARAFTGSDSGGTAIALTGNNTKVRTALGTLSSVDCRIASTGALTAGAKTLDVNHMGVTGFWSSGVGVALPPALDNLYSHDAGDYPIILGQNEGINIMNITAMGAAGVGTLYVNVELGEATSY